VEKLYEGTEGNPFYERNWFRRCWIPEVSPRTKQEPGVWVLRPLIYQRVICRPQFKSGFEKRIERLLRNCVRFFQLLRYRKAFDSRDLEALAGEKDVEDAIDRLVDEGLLEEERESRVIA